MHFERKSVILSSMLLHFNLLRGNVIAATMAPSETRMKLELVQVLFRHGERTPIEYQYSHYNSIFKIGDLSLYEPYGLGQLTNKGKNQAYNLGCMLRKRYESVLNARYSPDDVYAYSSDTDRTKVSLQLVLAGLYPPTPELMWNQNLNWLPIPYFYVPLKFDILLNVFKNPNYQRLFNSVIKSKENQLKIVKFIELVRSKLNNANDDARLYNGIPLAVSVLPIHKAMNLPVPSWYTAEIEEEEMKMSENYFESMSHTNEMKKLNGGVMIKQFLENISSNDKAAKGKTLYLYSGHDINIAAVLQALNLKTHNELLKFASALILEKYRDSNDRVYVKLLHWSTMDETMTTLNLIGNEEFCFIDNFRKITQDVTPTDEELDELLKVVDVRNVRPLEYENNQNPFD